MHVCVCVCLCVSVCACACMYVCMYVCVWARADMHTTPSAPLPSPALNTRMQTHTQASKHTTTKQHTRAPGKWAQYQQAQGCSSSPTPLSRGCWLLIMFYLFIHVLLVVCCCVFAVHLLTPPNNSQQQQQQQSHTQPRQTRHSTTNKQTNTHTC